MLNVVCILSKSLLNTIHKYHDAKHSFALKEIDCKVIVIRREYCSIIKKIKLTILMVLENLNLTIRYCLI